MILSEAVKKMNHNGSIYRDPSLLASSIETWIKDLVSRTGAKGAVIGLSGGVDSSALAALLRRALGRDRVLAIIMPCRSIAEDEADARLVAETLDIQIARVPLDETYEAIARDFKELGDLPDIAAANIKPRLRMTTLYAAAQARGALVMGSSNKCELTMGYFTKFGDSGVDALPFADLLKGEVFALARYLGVPDRIVDKPPSAGLWRGQTDEQEMGMTYADLDRYLATGEGPDSLRDAVEAARARTAHKRALPPSPTL